MSGLRVYVRYFCTAVQKLSHTSRYYPEGILKSGIRPVPWRMSAVLFTKYSCIFCQWTSGGGPPYVRTIDNGVHPVFQRTSALKNRGVRPPTLAYVGSKSPIFQNALLVDLSDPKSKLTL